MTKKAKKKAATKKIVAKKVCLTLLREGAEGITDALTFMQALIGTSSGGLKKLNGWVFGYDPGGNGKHGVAAIKVDPGKVVQCCCTTCKNAKGVLEWINDKQPMLAIGVDTLTHWSLGDGGWRKADRCLREKYPVVKLSVKSPNGLHGSMPINGMAVLMKIREKNSCTHVTETHPKVLYHALTNRKYHYKDKADKKHLSRDVQALIKRLELSNDHELDALISAYAALQGLKGCWTEDLAAAAHNDPLTVWPCGYVHYWWPEKIT